ncbi:unnamed protein product [Cylindrotheca closterium]|uniref:Helicase-associated domain-containing protein n=1 Tax=Cylindrotheca closterium TaxID=2856 RepID=A0AAD2FRD0_9STRA|nr:unnamed protein product [Cylindrotheca closterium]
MISSFPMISSTNNGHRKDSCSSYDNLLSLMISPLLPNLDEPSSSLPSSFMDPFDDLSMEPVPLSGSKGQALPSLVQSDSIFFMNDESAFDSIFMNEVVSNEPTCTPTPNHLQDLISILDPLTTSNQGAKRSNEAFFTGDDQVRAKKRQRPSYTHAVTPAEETMVRFRPYQETQWRAQFQKLIQYKLEHGHCSVPHAYPEDPILARWVKRQRYQYKKFNDNNPTSTMTTRRIQELESIGFVWDSHKSAWLEKLNELKVFKQQRGHCNVPSNYPQNAALSTWVKCQRRQYKLFITGSSSSTMTLERHQDLESLGFVFDIQSPSRKTN